MAIVRIQKNNRSYLAVSIGNGRYIDENGEIFTSSEKQKVARNVPKEVRDAFNEALTSYKKREKLQEKLKILQRNYEKKLEDCWNDILIATGKVRKGLGVITRKEFEHVFYDSLPYVLKVEMDRKGYRVWTPTGICYDDGHLYISSSYVAERFSRKAYPSYIYEEYDGCMFLVDDAKNMDSYKKALKKHSCHLSVSMNPIEVLDPGDKCSIWYHSTYEIPLEKPLTEEYAKELAATFAR